MHITLIASGSRGDVQPFVALALGLQAAGFHVRFATHEPFRQFVSERGLDFFPISGDPRQLLESEAGRRLLETGGNPFTFFSQLAKLGGPLAIDFTRDALAACRDADLIVCATSVFFGGESLSEKLGKPVVFASLQPMAPSAYEAGMLEQPLPRPLQFLGPWGYHWLTQWIGLQIYCRVFTQPVNRARAVHGLPRRSPWLSTRIFTQGPQFLYGFSRHVVPQPRDWADTQHICGYWFLDRLSDWRPAAELQAFLESGPPPVYIGFGSMSSRDPAETGRIAIDALQRSGQRGVLLRGWGGLHAEDVPASICLVDNVPHDWLFPRMAAVVHHGGAGTTSAGLRAGVPSILVPFMGDQPYWGRRVVALGVGPTPVPRKSLTAERLAGAIAAATGDAGMQERARSLGAQIRAEDGVGTAVAVLQRWLATR